MSPFVIALTQDLLVAAVLIGLAVYLANKRGRSPFIWGVAGILIVPTIVLFFLPTVPKQA